LFATQFHKNDGGLVDCEITLMLNKDIYSSFQVKMSFSRSFD